MEENNYENLEDELRLCKNKMHIAEWRAKAYKRAIIVLMVGISAVIVRLLIPPLSYGFALRTNGIRGPLVLHERNARERTVFCNQGFGTVYYFRRNRLGFWSAEEAVSEGWGMRRTPTYGLVYSWMGNRRFDEQSFSRPFRVADEPGIIIEGFEHERVLMFGGGFEMIPTFESHMFYFNTNAAMLIDIPTELLPPGVSVRIRQRDSDFSLHFTTFNPDGLRDIFDVYWIYELIDEFVR